MLCCLCCAGRVVTLPSAGDPLAGQQYIAAAELQAGRDGRNDRVVLGAALAQAAIQAYLKDEIQVRQQPPRHCSCGQLNCTYVLECVVCMSTGHKGCWRCGGCLSC